MIELLPPRPMRGSPDWELVHWAKDALKDVRDDIRVLKSCSGIFWYRSGHEPEDWTPQLIARLERRARLLSRFITRKGRVSRDAAESLSLSKSENLRRRA